MTDFLKRLFRVEQAPGRYESAGIRISQAGVLSKPADEIVRAPEVRAQLRAFAELGNGHPRAEADAAADETP